MQKTQEDALGFQNGPWGVYGRFEKALLCLSRASGQQAVSHDQTGRCSSQGQRSKGEGAFVVYIGGHSVLLGSLQPMIWLSVTPACLPFSLPIFSEKPVSHDSSSESPSV